MKTFYTILITLGTTILWGLLSTGCQNAAAQQPLTPVNPERFKVSLVGRYGSDSAVLYLVHDTKTGKEYIGLGGMQLAPL